MFDRVDCDGDFELPFERFKETTVQLFLQANPEQAFSVSTTAASSEATSVEASAAAVPPARRAGPSRDRAFAAPLAKNGCLCARSARAKPCTMNWTSAARAWSTG